MLIWLIRCDIICTVSTSNESEVNAVKEKIHPNYNAAMVTCVCGETFETKSTKKEIRVEVCSKCHPFYTGQRQRVVNAGGRVERFLKKYDMKKDKE